MRRISDTGMTFVNSMMRLSTIAIMLISTFTLIPRSSGADGQTEQPLADKQTQLADRYRKIEELFMRLADVEATENPERAALLRRAAKKSRDSFILERLSAAAGDISSEKYQQALTSQKAAREELESLLKLLMSEDRSKRIREKKDQIANAIKEVKRLERSERATRARTENGADLNELQEEQKSIEKRAADVEEMLRDEEMDPLDSESENESNAESQESESSKDGQEAKDGKESDSKDSDGKEGSEDAKESDNKSDENESDANSDDQKENQDPSENNQENEGGDSQSGEQKQSDSKESQQSDSEQQSDPQEGSQQQSDQQQSEQQGGQQEGGQQSQQQQDEQPPKTPEEAAQRAVEKARENMKRAQEKLEKAEREEAVEEQKKAEDELRKAIENLEKILRQLREEEMLRELARLESRLRQMAQMQSEVLDKTRQLAATPAEQRDRQTDIRAGNLAFDEKKIVMEADRAILLLREEGSSVAFPVVVDQMRDDMQSVADRLSQTKIDAVTQGIQEDILAALEEMIGALQKAQRDLEKQKQQQQQGQQQQSGQQGEPPLVQPLAELKLLRTMQTRIKSTTERYGSMLPEQSETAEDADVLNLVKSLAERQIKLYQISRDLLLKRNQ